MQAELLMLRQNWLARSYSLEVQARVAKRLDEPVDNLKSEMERCEKWLDAQDAELAELSGVREREAEAAG
jgi:hypothetical protein